MDKLRNVVPSFAVLLAAVESGQSVSQAEVKARFPTGTVDKWRRKTDLGPRLSRDLARLEAVLADLAGRTVQLVDAKPTKASRRRRSRSTSDHPHHWDIQAANDMGGPVVGVCRICGASQGFLNSIDDDSGGFPWVKQLEDEVVSMEGRGET